MKNSAGIADMPQGPSFSPVVAEKEVGFIPRPLHQQGVATEFVVFKLMTKSRGDVYVPLYQQNVIRGYQKNQDGSEDKSNPIYDTIRVLKGVYTIWESEQKDLKMDAKAISKARRSIKFEWMSKDSIARVPVTDIHALEALRLLPFNIETPGANKGSRFAYFEIDTNKQAEIEAKKRQNRRKAVRLAEEQPLDKIKKHAVYLRIRLNDEYGTPKIEKALRNEYEDYADLNPDIFLRSVGSQEVEIAYLVSKAISEAKIDTSTHQGSAYWATGAFICKIPSGQKAFEYLVEYATNPLNIEGKAFKEQLQNIST
jgi:hypothetical protein